MRKSFFTAFLILASIPFLQCSNDESSNDHFKLAVNGRQVPIDNAIATLASIDQGGHTGRALIINGYADGGKVTIKIVNWTIRISAEGGIAAVSYKVNKNASVSEAECIEVEGSDPLCDEMQISYSSSNDMFFSYLGNNGYGAISQCSEGKVSGSFELKAKTIDEKDEIYLIGEFANI